MCLIINKFRDSLQIPSALVYFTVFSRAVFRVDREMGQAVHECFSL